ncbi:hypothetical protein T265_11558 [Opisthorchis viverrini]|uniref:Uncharacterized protein n=1 Tax=Opisthorchis viverrini TaxID=6198 RepID=A0A074YY83_OPIVI|nr:hypothetical protein T265_11558 [Opisthorchis viverrini]KER19746.1 hypothetical protein T265_11558 [Opisthorchis viverrini]
MLFTITMDETDIFARARQSALKDARKLRLPKGTTQEFLSRETSPSSGIHCFRGFDIVYFKVFYRERRATVVEAKIVSDGRRVTVCWAKWHKWLEHEFTDLKLYHTYRCLAATPPEGCTRAEVLPGCPSLDRGSRKAESGFEPTDLRYRDSRSTH